ncbi:MAG: EAL domain-containing protein [Sphaerochaetaceae bacterium]|nr:EAL domain-containing protein [Sphaerochaetaceae bacterium]
MSPDEMVIVSTSISTIATIREYASDVVVHPVDTVRETLLLLDRNKHISIVLVDMNMPDNEGLNNIKALTSEKQYATICVIMITDANNPEFEIEGLRLGAIDYIRKPLHKESFLARIKLHQHLMHHNNMDEKVKRDRLMLDAIFMQAPVGIAISYGITSIDDKNDLFDVNPMYEQITGRTKEELKQLGWTNITHPDDVGNEFETYRKLKSGEIDSYSREKRYIKPDGSIVWVHLTASKIDIIDEKEYKHIALVQDITERKKIEASLIESERSKAMLLANLPGMAYRCLYNRKYTMEFISDGCLALTGYDPEELLNDKTISYDDITAPEYREFIWEEWKRVIELKQPFRFEYEIITAQGQRKWVWEMGRAVYDKEGKVEALEGIILDISDRKIVESDLLYHNEHDQWTGLYNRRYFEKILKQDLTIKSTIKRAIISVNLGTVHTLSTRYGYHYGIDLIKGISKALKMLCSDTYQLFSTHEYRFVYYVKGYRDKSELVSFGKEIYHILESLLTFERIGWGIGIIEINKDNKRNIELLLKNLLIASERAIIDFEKDIEYYFFDKELETTIERDDRLIQNLSQIAGGIDAERLFLHFQPIIDLKTNKICGFESLSRLNIDSMGLIPPLEFIPLAEKTKLIIPLGKNIIKQSLQFLHQMQSITDEKPYISINISIIQLLSKDFIHTLLFEIHEAKVKPHDIVLEITESTFASEFQDVNKILSDLKELGIRIALDDFGTGYSSLSRERELNVNYLKIDKFFIDKLLSLKEEETITADIISMAHKLGHEVIAEGVEHETQRAYLEKHGCDHIQGYLISKPLEPSKAIEFIKHYG